MIPNVTVPFSLGIHGGSTHLITVNQTTKLVEDIINFSSFRRKCAGGRHLFKMLLHRRIALITCYVCTQFECANWLLQIPLLCETLSPSTRCPPTVRFHGICLRLCTQSVYLLRLMKIDPNEQLLCFGSQHLEELMGNIIKHINALWDLILQRMLSTG